ncbi:hypothetical protein RRG08_043946 [Elysia crispata]|uniref:Uncharacterized protein n=1 Tax=Elysia crispata TaxID=231223 RepID=A0AAE0Y0Q1_9GAST|nr:hypothetical protein RRG08_043946 [Elysia crispata]
MALLIGRGSIVLHTHTAKGIEFSEFTRFNQRRLGFCCPLLEVRVQVDRTEVDEGNGRERGRGTEDGDGAVCNEGGVRQVEEGNGKSRDTQDPGEVWEVQVDDVLQVLSGQVDILQLTPVRPGQWLGMASSVDIQYA